MPLPDCCPCREGELIFEEEVDHYQEEIVEVRGHVRRFRIARGRCRRSGRRAQGRHREQTSDAIGAAAAQVGPRAVAIAAQLNKELGVAMGKVCQILALFGIQALSAASPTVSPTGPATTREQPMSQHRPAHNVIMQIKVNLLGVTKPPVWRRVQLRADTRLDQLHEILQAALGWENYHMHAFSFGNEKFGVPDPELGFNDERHVTLGELTDLGARLRYTYDFGDDWEHEILVEDLLDPDPDTHYPTLVAGKGACPPEDCGGPWGYADLKAILANPNDDEHQERLEWLGLNHASEFDPAALPTEDIAHELALSGASR